MSLFFASGGQSIESLSFSVSPDEYSGWTSRMDWLDPLAVQESSPTLQLKSINCLALSFIVQLTSIQDCWEIALTRWTFAGKVMSMLFNMLPRSVIAFLPRSKRLNFMAAVNIRSDFGAQKNSLTVSVVSPSICHKVMGLNAMILDFWMVSFKPAFSLASFTKRLFSSSLSL